MDACVSGVRLAWRRVPHTIGARPAVRRVLSHWAGAGASGGTRVLGRAVLGAATAVAGYATYQAAQAKAWLDRRMGDARELLSTGAALISAMAVDVLEDGIRVPGQPVSASESNSPADESDASDASRVESRPGFGGLLRRMAEVRALLRTVADGDALSLPAIVVVGSQSSGKSSVVEAIVGRSFLPTGRDMVTRRPLEITLVHTPEAKRAYAVFGDDADGARLTDFGAVRSALAELNAAVPAEQGVSDRPVVLRIHAADVPDATLVDLPGLVQVSGADQPAALRERIAALSAKYVAGDNIVLAVSAADVDLANSAALRVSRAADPEGRRTLGVLTKLDLVDAEAAASLLATQAGRYPLALGYVGVSLPPGREGGDGADVRPALNAARASGRVGISALRQRMSSALEARMLASLGAVAARASAELAAVRYALRVEYADRDIAPGTYAVGVAAGVREAVDAAAARHGRSSVREAVRRVLHARALSICSDAFWRAAEAGGPGGSTADLGVDTAPGKKEIRSLEGSTDSSGHRAEAKSTISRDADPVSAGEESIASDGTRLYGNTRSENSAEDLQTVRVAAERLLHSGVGAAAAGAVADAIVADARAAVGATDVLRPHVGTRERLASGLEDALRGRASAAAEAVEDALRPHKALLEWTADEWASAKRGAARLLAHLEDDASVRLDELRSHWGASRLVRAARRVLGERTGRSLGVLSAFGVDSALPAAGSWTRPGADDAMPNARLLEAVWRAAALHAHIQTLRRRRAAVERCGAPEERRGGLPSVRSLSADAGAWLLRSIFGRRGAGASPLQPIDAPTHVWHACQAQCPEAFLYLVAERLAAVAAPHVHEEMVRSLAFSLPAVAQAAMPVAGAPDSGAAGPGSAKKETAELALLRENPAALRHWTLVERRRVLEDVLGRLAVMQHLRAHAFTRDHSV